MRQEGTAVAATVPEVGTDWIYRERPSLPSQRVKIIAIEHRKQTTRVDVEFLDDPKAGNRENVPGNRLYGSWAVVTEFDERMANWDRLHADGSVDSVEEYAISEVFHLLIPEEVAVHYTSPVREGTSVYDQAALELILQCPLSDITGQVAWFDRDGTIELSAAGTLCIAEFACAARPEPILEWLLQDEAEWRERCKRGHDRGDGSGRTSPEWEYERYRERIRPRHELLRQWCGYRAWSQHERLVAAEAEMRRLDILIARLIDQLRTHETEKWFVEAAETEHERDRITPATIRPVIDRPLSPAEMPVRYIERRRHWPR